LSKTKRRFKKRGGGLVKGQCEFVRDGWGSNRLRHLVGDLRQDLRLIGQWGERGGGGYYGRVLKEVAEAMPDVNCEGIVEEYCKRRVVLRVIAFSDCKEKHRLFSLGGQRWRGGRGADVVRERNLVQTKVLLEAAKQVKGYLLS
jgi:hypothetical protein